MISLAVPRPVIPPEYLSPAAQALLAEFQEKNGKMRLVVEHRRVRVEPHGLNAKLAEVLSGRPTYRDEPIVEGVVVVHQFARRTP